MSHTFQHCQVFAESLLEGIIISEILKVDRPPSNEGEFWQLFCQPTKGSYLRKCLAALTFHNAWLNRNSPLRKHTIAQQMNSFVTQELDSIKRTFLEKNAFRKEKQHWKIRWRINNKNWLKTHNTVFSNIVNKWEIWNLGLVYI